MVGVGNRTTTSKVWVHFKKLVDGGKCNLCSSVVKGKGGNTSNLEKHLRLKHNIVLKRCNLFDLLTPSPSTTATCTQPGKFMNGKVKEENCQSLHSKVFHRTNSTDIKSKNQQIVVTSSPDMTYVGQNFGKKHCTSNKTTKSYVGIYDEKTGKMRVCEAQLFHMMPNIPGRDEEEEEKPQTIPAAKNYLEKLEMLTEAFGNKWKKSALEKSRRKKIDEQTLKDHLAADIDHGREQAKFHEQNAEEKETGFEVTPPCNKNAEVVEDVYQLSDILSDIDMAALQSPATVFFESTTEKIKEWKENKVYPDYVINHVSCMPMDPELRWKRCKCLIYVHYMMHLYKLTARQIGGKDPYPKDCPGLIKNKLRESFTKTAVRVRCMPSRLKDRLAAFILTLCLLIDEFTLDLTDILQDMKIERNKLFLILKSLGCKVNKKIKNDEEKYTARLKIPLEFPQKALFKQKRQNNR